MTATDHQWTVHYMDRKGAGCMRSFSSELMLRLFVERLRREARIERDGEVIGHVYRESGEVDDKRVRWLWNFESLEMEQPRKCPKCGTNGDHYCPASVDTGETDPEEQE